MAKGRLVAAILLVTAPLVRPDDDVHDPASIYKASQLQQDASNLIFQMKEETLDHIPLMHDADDNASGSEDTATQGKQQQRLWGSPQAGGGSPTSGHTGGPTDSEENDASSLHQRNDVENSTRTQPHLFVAGKQPKVNSNHSYHSPPEGFSLSARVYIDPADRLAHFDDTPHRLPYWDCGATGATTSPISLKNGYFRHALQSTSTSWSGTDGKHPVLVVALSSLVLELNSGTSQSFQAGDVFLLEDVLLSGHRMRPVSGDLKVLFLTLPRQHYHTGKHHLSIKSATISSKETQDPCPDIAAIDGDHQDSFQQAPQTTVILNSHVNVGRRIRLTILAAAGLSLSTLAADFLGKTAPLWLAVGVGGSFFVVGSTYALTVAGDRALAAIELWGEQRRLRPSPDRIEADPSLGVMKNDQGPPEAVSM
jgi:hypothetical protein